jgi:hypothetical protein
VNPPRNRKGGTGNPPPTVGASEFYPNGTKAKAGYSQGGPEATNLGVSGGQGVHREVESEGHEGVSSEGWRIQWETVPPGQKSETL